MLQQRPMDWTHRLFNRARTGQTRKDSLLLREEPVRKGYGLGGAPLRVYSTCYTHSEDGRLSS